MVEFARREAHTSHFAQCIYLFSHHCTPATICITLQCREKHLLYICDFPNLTHIPNTHTHTPAQSIFTLHVAHTHTSLKRTRAHRFDDDDDRPSSATRSGPQMHNHTRIHTLYTICTLFQTETRSQLLPIIASHAQHSYNDIYDVPTTTKLQKEFTRNAHTQGTHTLEQFRHVIC